MTKLLIRSVGFNKAVQYVSIVVCFTCLVSFWLATPNPAHNFRKPEKWLKLRVWVDTHAFRDAAFCWFMAAISFMFFGFYDIFFNLEDVRTSACITFAQMTFADIDCQWAFHEHIGYKGTASSEPHPDGALRTFYFLSIMNGCSTVGRIGSAYLCD